ncbi:Fatty-acid amide hydrolase 2-B [Araneus ventricosus]|uniref:Fatty-acid amide hydrolase 2-B n=1 Tax=Araneus ventricosus TaxID=182803 RepID=A0A4Y2RBU0_ARAVE|nr:Fatty-acid amide hydrolase 2-B [Araneus ventricosus]
MIKGLTQEFNDILDEDTVLLLPTAPYVAPYHNGTWPFLLSCCYTSIVNILGLPSTQCPMGFSEQKLPYGIQIVGSKGNDALTIACAVELEKAFGGWKPPGEL